MQRLTRVGELHSAVSGMSNAIACGVEALTDLRQSTNRSSKLVVAKPE
jgi:hypothetical protein